TYESQAQKVEDWIKYKDDCRKTRFVDGSVGVEVLPPDINLSDEDFTVVISAHENATALNGHVRFGMKAIKGAGKRAIEAIVAERKANGPYKSLYDFCERVPPGTVNKATIEALVVCGAFDSVHAQGRRAAMVATIDSAVAAGQSLAKDRAAGQGGLFGGGDDDAPVIDDRPEPALARAREWDEGTMLAKEKEVLGFYVSSHPLDRFATRVEEFGNTSSVDLSGRSQDQRVIVGGLIKSVRPVTTKKGDRMAIVTFEDLAGQFDAVLFPRTYAECAHHLTTDAIVFLIGDVDHSRGDPQLKVEKVIPVDRADADLATRVELTIDTTVLNGSAEATLLQLSGLVKSRGVAIGAEPVPVELVIREARQDVLLESRLKITPTPDLLADLRTVLGDQSVRVRGGKPVTQGGRKPFRPRVAG
ncbi:MAG: OB-fold nucleic acid binding domain-containing protein, partial [Planctomycetota bacterium]